MKGLPNVQTAIIGVLSLLTMVFNTMFWFVPLILCALAKLVIPIQAWRRLCTKGAIWCAENWISVNSFMIDRLLPLRWHVQGVDDLRYDAYYLVISNHQSWADIAVLQYVFNRRIPFLKFFLKQELIWVPLLGLCWWGLDYPFMKRYSRAQIEKRPSLRGKDLETTRKAVEKFRLTPVSVINFLEGTRITPERKAEQNAPYKLLLKPKAGGIGFVLGAMGDQIQTMLDVTIAYPEGIPTAWAFLSGQVEDVVVHVRTRTIPEE